MAIELSNLWVAIGAKTSGLASGIAEAGRIIGTFAANTKVQIAKINAAWAGFENIKGLTGLTLGLTLLGTALALSIGPAIQFESAFANVSKTVEGTPQQLGQIRSEILAMADSMPLAATEIAEVAATAGQLGVATRDVTEFTRVMVMLGTATNLTAEQAATSMARFTNIMQIPVRELPLLSAALVHLGNNSAATESEILTLGLRLAAAGSQLGLSGQQVLALSAGMKSLGITAEVGGSAMSRVLIDMVSASGPKMETFARIIGVTRGEFETMVKSRSPEAAGKLVLGFVEGLQRVDQQGGSVRKVLQELGLDSIRLRDTLLRLVGGGDQLAQSFALVADKSVYGGALLAEYGRFAETTASRLEILKNRLTGIAIDIGTPTLGALVTVFDGIGDALLRVQQILAPVATQIFEVFANAGKGVQLFYSTLASPVLSGAAASLGGLAQVVALLAGAFNSLGPAGLILAGLLADLYFVGPVSVGIQALVVSIQSVGVAATVSAAGVKALNAALTAGPLIVAGAALYAYGKALQSAKGDAEELSNALSQDLARSLEAGDWTGFSRKIQETEFRLKFLQNELGNGKFGWETIGLALKGFGELLPWVDNKVINTAAEAKALKGVLDDPNFGGNFRFNVKELADDLGISEQAAFNLIAATGQLETAQLAGSSAFLTIKSAAKDYLLELQGVSRETGVSTEEMLGQQVSVESLAKSYGVSMQTMMAAMAEAKVVEEDLFDPKKYNDVLQKLDEIIGPWQRIADASGQSADAIQEETNRTKGLIAAQKELVEAFDQVKAARAAAQFPLENLRQATEAFAKATEEYKAGNISLEQYGQALLNLNSAQAAVAPTVDEAIRMQGENSKAFRDTALAAGETEAAISEVLVNWGLLTRAEAAKLKVEGADVLDLARQRVKDLRESLEPTIIAKMALDSGRTEDDIRRLLAQGDEWATSLFEAEMAAATEGPLRDIADLLVQAGIWDETEAEAFLSANPEEAFAKLEAMFSLAETWGSSEWVGIFTADVSDVEAREGQASAAGERWQNARYNSVWTADVTDVAARESEATAMGRRYADGEYKARLEGDNTDALSKTKQASDEANRYWTTPYQSKLTSDNTDALSKAEGAISGANKYAAGKYTGVLTGNNTDALNKTNTAEATATKYARTYEAKLTAKDFASGVIGAVAGLAAGFARTYTATLVTNNVTKYTTIGNNAMPIAQGAIFTGAGVKAFAGGGFENHVAQIAQGRWPARLWAEPETGGEAYIPLAMAKRARSTQILGKVADKFGYGLVPMAEGGYWDQASMAAVLAAAGWRAMGSNRFARTSTVQIDAPINLSFTGIEGINAREVAQVVEVSVKRALGDVNRKLANARR